MGNSIKQKTLIIIIVILVMIFSIFRENLAQEINAIIYGYEYNSAGFYFLYDELVQMKVENLILLKWLLVPIFFILFSSLHLLAVRLIFNVRRYVKITFVFYFGVAILMLIVGALTGLLGVFDEVYYVLRKLIGFVFSPLPLFMFWLMFYAIKYQKKYVSKLGGREGGRTILFVHIPKTAGSTLHNIFNDFYSKVFHIEGLNPKESLEQFGLYDSVKQNSFEVVKGHLTLRLKGSLINPYIITYMRNPVDLFLSQYFYVKRAKKSKYHSEVSQMNSIEEFMEFVVKMGHDNLQTRHLSDATLHITDENEHPLSFEKDGKDLLEKAKNNLRLMDLVFDTKEFDKSLIILKDKLGWTNQPYYLSKNVTKNRKKADQFSEEQLGKIEELLSYDIELYEYSKGLKCRDFEIDNLEEKTKSFQLRNKVYQRLMRPINKVMGIINKILNKFL